MGESDPKPSEVRQRILSEHAALRVQLDGLERAADGLSRGAVAAADAKEIAEVFLAALRKHMAGEERVLVPALREADGFGPARADDLLREHREQRELLTALLAEITGAPGPAELEGRIRELVRRIREDIEYEDAHHLTAEILKDSVITGAFGG